MFHLFFIWFVRKDVEVEQCSLYVQALSKLVNQAYKDAHTKSVAVRKLLSVKLGM